MPSIFKVHVNILRVVFVKGYITFLLFIFFTYCRILTLNSNGELPSFQPRLINMKDYGIIDFSKEKVCFVVISTSGDGNLHFQFCCSLKNISLPHNP